MAIVKNSFVRTARIKKSFVRLQEYRNPLSDSNSKEMLCQTAKVKETGVRRTKWQWVRQQTLCQKIPRSYPQLRGCGYIYHANGQAPHSVWRFAPWFRSNAPSSSMPCMLFVYNISVYTCVYINIHKHISIYIYIYAYVSLSLSLYIYICMSLSLSIYIYIYSWSSQRTSSSGATRIARRLHK